MLKVLITTSVIQELYPKSQETNRIGDWSKKGLWEQN